MSLRVSCLDIIYNVSYRVIELKNASCDSSVSKTALDSLEEYGLSAEIVFTVGHSACAGTVGDKNRFVALDLGNDGVKTGIDVEGVSDDLCRNVIGCESCAYDTGISVSESGHRVEEVMRRVL